MPRHRETRLLPYTPQQLFALVADVRAYPDFLPWVTAATIRSETGCAAIAEITVRFAVIEETVVSRVAKAPPSRISSSLLEGPLERLDASWSFEPVGAGTELSFELDYAFPGGFLWALSSAMFDRALARAAAAFEERARQLFGTPLEPRHTSR